MALPAAEGGLIQVAGVKRAAEARMLLDAGVDLVGIPLRLDVHAPDVSEAGAARIVAACNAPGRFVVITYETDPGEIAALCDAVGAHAVQLHSTAGPQAVMRLRRLRPKLSIIKSLVVGHPGMARPQDAARELAGMVDAFLTDTFDARSGASGATGRTHDWEVSRCLAARAGAPVILAGGLTPDNVARAIALVRPAGVDAHTGLENEEGDKDPELVRAFVRNARAAFAGLNGG